MNTKLLVSRVFTVLGHRVNAALRWTANRISGGYFARLDSRTAKILALTEENRNRLRKMQDRLSDEALVVHLYNRLMDPDAPARAPADPAAKPAPQTAPDP